MWNVSKAGLVKRVTMYTPRDFPGSAGVLQHLAERDLVSVNEDDSLISVAVLAPLAPLDDEERAAVYRLLRYAVPDSDKPLVVKRPALVGGRAAIAGTRTPVWHIVNAHRQGASQYDLRKQFGLSDEAIGQALAYYDAHQEEIDADIFENERPFVANEAT